MRGQPPRPNCAGPPPQGHHCRAVPPRFLGPGSRPKPALCPAAPSRNPAARPGAAQPFPSPPAGRPAHRQRPQAAAARVTPHTLPGFTSARFPSTWFDPPDADPTDADPTRCVPTGCVPTGCVPTGCDPTDQGPGKPPPTSLTPHRNSAGVHPRPGRESQS